MKITKSKKGFTLTEILVVVLVIAVLAAIAYPLYTKAITKSKAVEAINLLQMVRNKQLQNFAKKGSYMEDFSKIGNLTIDAETQSLNPDGTIKINDYTLALNPSKNCMTATYQKGNTNFMFASSYETPGLGCTGSICTSFGDIVGSASDVCNCGSKTCSNNFELNPNTCACECNQCLSGGYCMAPTQTESENRMCPDGKSMQTRTCTASCGGGDCTAWSPATCPVVKTACPATCQAGYKRDTSVSYSEDGSCCVAKTACPANCQVGYKRDTNVTSSDDGACCIAKTPCPSSCPAGQKRTASQYQEDGACCQNNCTTDQTALNLCNKTNGYWNTSICQCECHVNEVWNTSEGCVCGNQYEEEICASTGGAWKQPYCLCTCPEGKNFNITQGCVCTNTSAKETCLATKGTWDAIACSCKCPDSQTWNSKIGCSTNECDPNAKPATTQSCGNCNLGTQTRTVTCDTTTTSWKEGSWGTCKEGGCKPNEIRSFSCPGLDGSEMCNDQCEWEIRRPCQDSNECTGPSSQACGNCGTQTRTCNSGTWSEWSACIGQGVCAPKATQSCGAKGGIKTCSNSCTWGECACAEGYTMVNGKCCIDDGCQCQLDEKGEFCAWSTNPGSGSQCYGWGCAIGGTGGTCLQWKKMACKL